MNRINKKFDIYFEKENIGQEELYSGLVLKSLIRSILEPIARYNTKSLIFLHLDDFKEVQSLIKRLEYSANSNLIKFSDFDFSKYDIEQIGFIILTTQRYNAVLLYKKIDDDKYKIYFKINSKLVSDVYETLKNVFCINYDEAFYEHRPERRENELSNDAIFNIVKEFEEINKENIYQSKIQENYKTVNEKNTDFRNEIYQSVKQIAHEIKNQISILDIYTRIFEKKTGDTEVTQPLKKSINMIKAQVDQFKNIDVINLQEKNIKNIIQDSIKMYSSLLKEKNNKLILIDEMAGVEARAFVDEEKFLIVINNIIKNAHDSTADDDIIIRLVEDDDKIKISITNHGEMIELKQQDKIFEQGFTTKKDGWGVGLSVCKKFIGSQFGTFELTKSDENETTFTLTIPLAQLR